jgi:hypothetical protein
MCLEILELSVHPRCNLTPGIGVVLRFCELNYHDASKSGATRRWSDYLAHRPARTVRGVRRVRDGSERLVGEGGFMREMCMRASFQYVGRLESCLKGRRADFKHKPNACKKGREAAKAA